ncbi:hypothetical protein [Bacillus sp. T33-2]|uniref:hypothetical protein n=1 Tax=Bacillus sp. T33-2 TaxID=2054168 RepID=UPI000C7846F3|nr:hypothetical protein [Bacillus sp. T33-2]PLR99567.1 hypothetical protein CVD19_00455 [Bacillus sp. T33-2]
MTKFATKTIKKIPTILDLYYSSQLSVKQISSLTSTHHKTVSDVLKTFGTGLRSPSEQTLLNKPTILSETARQNILYGIRNNRYTPEYAAKLSASQTGSKNNQAKLTDEQVIQIRQEYSLALQEGYAKFETQRILAKKYGVKRPTISDIVLCKTWKHILV